MTAEQLQADQFGYEKCVRLLENADFQWFMEEVERQRASKLRELRDIRTKPDAREAAAHALDALDGIAEYVPTSRDIFARNLPHVPK